ncbi:MAG TPA: RnfABCDGE type electron transport complex subunit G [Tissierellaceae bacterium]
MKETIKLGLTLLIIAAISGAVLAGTNEITGPIIAEMEKESTFGAFFELFEEADDFKELDEAVLNDLTENHPAVVEAYEAVDSGEGHLGYVLKAKSGGYGGDMFIALGISEEGTVTGIKVVGHSETPSIGDRIEKEEFTDSFVDKSAEGDLKAVAAPSQDDEVQMLSGATVSTNAVLNGINKALVAYREILAN